MKSEPKVGDIVTVNTAGLIGLDRFYPGKSKVSFLVSDIRKIYGTKDTYTSFYILTDGNNIFTVDESFIIHINYSSNAEAIKLLEDDY